MLILNHLPEGQKPTQIPSNNRRLWRVPFLCSFSTLLLPMLAGAIFAFSIYFPAPPPPPHRCHSPARSRRPVPWPPSDTPTASGPQASRYMQPTQGMPTECETLVARVDCVSDSHGSKIIAETVQETLKN